MKTTKKVPLIFVMVNQDLNLKLIKFTLKSENESLKYLNIWNIQMQ